VSLPHSIQPLSTTQNPTECSYVGGVRLGGADHFTEAEYELLPPNSEWKYTKVARCYTLAELADGTKLLEFEQLDSIHESTCCARYVHLLAYYQRLQLPLDTSLQLRLQSRYYPIAETPNFLALEALFDRHYDLLFPLKKGKVSHRERLLHRMKHVALYLWLAGYGILPGFAIRTVDEHSLRVVSQARAGGNPFVVSVHVLWDMLLKDEQSPVREPWRQPVGGKTFFEIEEENWKSVLNAYPDSQVIASLHTYVFSEARGRCEGKISRLYVNENGTEIRERLGKIKPRSWYAQSRLLRQLAPAVAKYSVEELLVQERLVHALADLRAQSEMSTRNFNYIKWHAATWADWYSKTQQRLEGLVLHRAIPPTLRRSTKHHAKQLDLNAAGILIGELLHMSMNLIEENDLLQYRCRRACLIMLSTGARVSQTLCLKQDALTQDGDEWRLYFHANKTDKEYVAWADEELRGWFADLLQFAPPNPILIPRDKDNGGTAGDDLEALRVFASNRNDGPMSADSVRQFLIRLQAKIWPTQHPNGEFFSAHDLRRLQAQFMVLAGYAPEMIKAKLHHDNLTSTLTYMGKNPDAVKDFAMLFKKGVYKNVSADPGSSGIAVDAVVAQVQSMTPNKQTEEHVIRLLDRVFTETKEMVISSTDRGEFTPSTPVATGNPLHTHNCHAPARYNCGATVSHCFACGDYTPDRDRLEDHTALVFRAMIGVIHNEALAEHHKLKGERIAVYKRTDTERKLIDGAKSGKSGVFYHTFGRGYGMAEKERETLRKRMWTLAEKWYKKNGKLSEQPTMTQAEALLFLATSL